MDALTKRIVLRAPDADPEYLATGALVVSLRDRLVGQARTPLFLLLGAAGMVLLVACTNLASTLLARGAGRTRELAVRTSLGASRSRLVRQLLTESLVLATLGAAGGTAMAFIVLKGIHGLNPSSLPRLSTIGIDGPVLAYTGAMTVLTALLFGLLPARRLAGLGVGSALRDGGRGTTAYGRRIIWPVLVGTEVALSLVLLVGSGLLIRSFQALLSEEVGFDPRDSAVLSISLSRLKYETEGEHAQWYSELLRELEAHPDISSAGVFSSVPLQGFFPNGRLQLDDDMEKQASGGYVVASAGAFEALDIPLLRGRLFNQGDGPDDAHVALVSQSFAERYWPGEDPIGKSVTGGGMDNLYSQRVFSRVVGVVGDVRFESLGREGMPTVFFSHTQRPFRIQYGTGVVMEATTGYAETLVNPVRSILQRLDSDVPLRFRTMERVLGNSVAERRFILLVLSGFSLTGLVLALVGIYGVVSYTVAKRAKEMGIRLALGATPPAVVKTVMGASLRIVAVGLALGIVAALVLSQLMGSLLYEVGPGDPLTLVVVVAILASAAAVASFIPARAGVRVDPADAMRAE
jgi:predicted permease